MQRMIVVDKIPYRFTQKSLRRLPEVLTLYYGYNLTITEVSNELKMDHKTISNLLKEYGKGLRSRKDEIKIGVAKGKYVMSEEGKQNIIKGIRQNRNTPEYIAKLATACAGEKCYNAKLNDEAVINIRQEYEHALLIGKEKTETQKLLADQYGVKRSTISDIVLGKTWKHLI